jgi:hypothetical protein
MAIQRSVRAVGGRGMAIRTQRSSPTRPRDDGHQRATAYAASTAGLFGSLTQGDRASSGLPFDSLAVEVVR